MTTERTTYDDAGLLDEVVVTGGAHLERLSGEHRDGLWCLTLRRSDGTEICLLLYGELTMTEGS